MWFFSKNNIIKIWLFFSFVASGRNYFSDFMELKASQLFLFLLDNTPEASSWAKHFRKILLYCYYIDKHAKKWKIFSKYIKCLACCRLFGNLGCYVCYSFEDMPMCDFDTSWCYSVSFNIIQYKVMFTKSFYVFITGWSMQKNYWEGLWQSRLLLQFITTQTTQFGQRLVA